MRHRKKTVKLGRTSAHRNELLSNLVCGLIEHGRIKTTQPLDTSSDDRLKHNEKNINNGLDIVRQLNPQFYQKTQTFKTHDYRGPVNEPYILEAGLIAQEVANINDISFTVSIGNDIKPYSVAYNNVFIYGLAAIKELDTIVNTNINNIKDISNNMSKLTGSVNLGNIENFINGKLGSNLIFKYKSRSMTLDLINIAKIAKSSVEEIFKKNNISEPNIILFIDNLISYKLCEVTNLFEIETKKEATFDFDIQNFLNSRDKDDQFSLDKLKFKNKKQLLFALSEDQTNQLKSYNDLFGKSIEGISRTLSRVYVKKLFRKPINDDLKILKEEFTENNSRRWGGGLESI